MNTAFEAEPSSSPVQPDVSKWKVLAVSLLYTERIHGEVPERPLTAREVAQALGISVELVRELCHRGALEHFRVGNAFRVFRAELERFIREHTKRRRARDMTVQVRPASRRR